MSPKQEKSGQKNLLIEEQRIKAIGEAEKRPVTEEEFPEIYAATK